MLRLTHCCSRRSSPMTLILLAYFSCILITYPTIYVRVRADRMICMLSRDFQRVMDMVDATCSEILWSAIYRKYS